MEQVPVKEIPLRDVILTLQTYGRAGLRGWPWLLLGALLLGGLQAWRVNQEAVFYEAATVFVVNKQQSGGNALGSVLGRFGLGGGAGDTGHSPKRVMAFATSRQLLHRLLLDTAELGGRHDLFINHLIEQSGFAEEWKLQELYGLDRLSTNQLDSLSRQERSLLKMVYAYLTLDPEKPIQKDISDETGMLTITARTRNEALSIYLSTALYHYLSDFYTEESTGQSLASVERLKARADSLLTEINRAEYQLANLADTQLSLTRQRDQVRRLQLQRQVNIATLAYGEVVRNLETAKFAMDGFTPFFQLVDAPFSPLRPAYPQPLKAGIRWGIIGALLAFLGLCAVFLYRNIMHSDD
ncbi:hypothetical protein QWY85_18665 [Neolewinella lacunae]|uniref:Polysaccharide chain length determinant N-terminal domain-containing protein n=1 Tax=Neolewinella lacunae TaxID=1517758 RepID=A0A923T8N5_9BACT|nr:hypothetical protein [Neolewinella lacunae]MBC6994153.1 hypothetical protein [Neolewinella lacunae]MDN3636698.1 hypothetical protein [Neolewinella lacunae]